MSIAVDVSGSTQPRRNTMDECSTDATSPAQLEKDDAMRPAMTTLADMPLHIINVVGEGLLRKARQLEKAVWHIAEPRLYWIDNPALDPVCDDVFNTSLFERQPEHWAFVEIPLLFGIVTVIIPPSVNTVMSLVYEFVSPESTSRLPYSFRMTLFVVLLWQLLRLCRSHICISHAHTVAAKSRTEAMLKIAKATEDIVLVMEAVIRRKQRPHGYTELVVQQQIKFHTQLQSDLFPDPIPASSTSNASAVEMFRQTLMKTAVLVPGALYVAHFLWRALLAAAARISAKPSPPPYSTLLDIITRIEDIFPPEAALEIQAPINVLHAEVANMWTIKNPGLWYEVEKVVAYAFIVFCGWAAVLAVFSRI